MNTSSSSILPPPVAAPSSVTIQGAAWVNLYSLGRPNHFWQLHFKANQDFKIGEKSFSSDHFVEAKGAFGDRLYDFSDITAPMKARDFFHLQRVEITIVHVLNHYELGSLKILSGLGFNPDFDLNEFLLRSYPRQDLLPAKVVSQLAENAAIRETFESKHGDGPSFESLGLNMSLPYRRWYTKSGRAQDLVCREVEENATKTV